MSKIYEKCKDRNEYYCWSHIDHQHKHFFKVMIGDFCERMTIPDKFAQHFKEEITTIELESCNGYTFDVQVIKKLGKVVLQSGWEAFVSAHDLKMGDFLVFKYDGNSQLKVLIFDPSGCEKLSLCAMKNATHVGQTWEEPIDISSSCHDLPMKSPQSERKAEAYRDRSSQGNKIIDISSSSAPSEMSEYVISSDDDAEAHFVPSCILPRGTCLTEDQEKKVEEKVQAIHSETPLYGCVMTKYNVFGRPCLLDFSRNADAYLPYEEQTLMLKRHGKSWKVRYRINKNNSKRLCQGWGKFAHDNNLRIGDLCLFELPKKKKYLVNVHIIRKR